MPNDLQETTLDAQADPATITQQEETTTEDNASVESQGVQSPEQGDNSDELGPNNLPPELENTRKELLRDYHAKLQSSREDKLRFEAELQDKRAKAETLGNLFQQDWFKKALEDEKARRNGTFQETQMTDEQFELVKNDKTAFMKLVSGLAEKMVTTKVDPVISNHQANLEDIQLEREFESAKGKFKDFESLNSKGALDSYLEEGYDFATAYKLYKADNIKESDIDARASEKARELLDESRNGAISKGGLTKASGSRVLEASNFDDAFDQVFHAYERGEKDVKVNRKK